MRWLGYGPEHDEWVHEEELADGAKEMVEAVGRKSMGYTDIVVRVNVDVLGPLYIVPGAMVLLM